MSDDEERLRQREAAARRELFAVLAHELRSPIGAILGFEELLSEGILGELPPGTADALARIRGSARQLLDLVAGLNDLASDAVPSASLEPVDTGDILAAVLHALEAEASGRGGGVVRQGDDVLPFLVTDPERVRRALQLTFMAAIKTTAGGTLTVHAGTVDGGLHIRIEGSRLDPHGDDPEQSLQAEDGARLSGSGLRIGMARTALASLGGSLELQPGNPGTRILITLPAASTAA